MAYSVVEPMYCKFLMQGPLNCWLSSDLLFQKISCKRSSDSMINEISFCWISSNQDFLCLVFGQDACSGRCKAIVRKIVEHVRAETEQWSQMQGMLGQVRDEMEELQASRDFWEDRALESDDRLQTLQNQVCCLFSFSSLVLTTMVFSFPPLLLFFVSSVWLSKNMVSLG